MTTSIPVYLKTFTYDVGFFYRIGICHGPWKLSIFKGATRTRHAIVEYLKWKLFLSDDHGP